MSWRNKVEPILRNYLEIQINESSKYKSAYSLSKNPSNAQLWIAIANLAKQNFDLNLKIKILENALKDVINRERAKEAEKNQKYLKTDKSGVKIKKESIKNKRLIKKRKASKLEKSLGRF